MLPTPDWFCFWIQVQWTRNKILKSSNFPLVSFRSAFSPWHYCWLGCFNGEKVILSVETVMLSSWDTIFLLSVAQEGLLLVSGGFSSWLNVDVAEGLCGRRHSLTFRWLSCSCCPTALFGFTRITDKLSQAGVPPSEVAPIYPWLWRKLRALHAL